MDLYQEVILEHYKHPLNKGSFEDQKNVLSSSKMNVGCGDAFRVEVKIHKDMIQDILWEGQGCAISTAAVSVVSEHVKGKNVHEVASMNEEQVLELLGLEEIVEGRKKCLMLGISAIQEVLKAI